MKVRTIRSYKILAVALTATAGAATGCAKAGPGAEVPVTDLGGARVDALDMAEGATVPAATAAAFSDGVRAGAPSRPSSDGGVVLASALVPEATARVTAALPAAVAPSRARPSDAVLHQLQQEVTGYGRSYVLQHLEQYRPLCDRDGYPLVGNMVGGKGDQPDFQPSALCAEVRKLGES